MIDIQYGAQIILVIYNTSIVLSMKPTQKQKQKPKIPKIDVNIDVAKNIFEAHNIPIYSPLPLYEGQKMFASYIIQCLNSASNALVQSPTGTGKTLSLLCSTLSWVRYQQQLGKLPIRIIYTSRTHAQLKQVVQQLIKTGFDVKLSILGSRDQTCVNDDLSQLTGQSKQLECRLRVMKKNDLYCKYFHHQDYYMKMNSLGRIADLEDMKYLGKTQGFCPFFYEKHCKNIANLILMPYTYLLDEKTSSKEQFSSLIQNSILIFDEAHNIPSACESSKQFSINLSTLSRALQHLSDLRQKKLQQEKKFKSSKPIQADEQVQKYMKSTVTQLQMHASYICLIHAHMQTLPIALEQPGLVMNMHDFLQCLQNGTQQGEFGKLKNKISELTSSIASIGSDILLKPYWALQVWFNFIYRIEQLYKICQSQNGSQVYFYTFQILYDGADIKINMFCLDPKVGFQRIVNLKPRSIILTSGTLNPLNSIALQLQAQFNKPLACPHIMNKDQVNGCILTQGPNNIKLNFNFENRNNKQLYKELGSVLFQIISRTPNGVIIFVPSYFMLEKVKIQLTNNGYMSKFYMKKNIFFQKQNSADFKQILQKYMDEACKSKGALLFALSRGKISQGLDFADQKCRAVVMIGVPYPAAKDLKVTSKMEYLDNKSKTTKSLNGNQWYICETIRCINQSIGRIIRNKNDYGSIYLLDQRFKKNQILNQISGWAKQSLKVIDKYEDFIFKLEIFQEYFRKKNAELEEAQFFFTSNMGTKLTNKIDLKPKTAKHSISMSKQQYENKNVDPEKQRQMLTNQLKTNEPAQKIQKPKQLTLQKIIFASKPKKTSIAVQAKECPVCRQQRRLIKNTECIHQICDQCWDIWLKKDLRCPICRVRIREKYLIKS